MIHDKLCPLSVGLSRPKIIVITETTPFYSQGFKSDVICLDTWSPLKYRVWGKEPLNIVEHLGTP